jgi:hypothetical protein
MIGTRYLFTVGRGGKGIFLTSDAADGIGFTGSCVIGFVVGAMVTHLPMSRSMRAMRACMRAMGVFAW